MRRWIDEPSPRNAAAGPRQLAASWPVPWRPVSPADEASVSRNRASAASAGPSRTTAGQRSTRNETADGPATYRVTDDLAAVPSDAELMARVVARDEGAFAQVYDRYVRAIYGTALRYLRDPGAAEDVVQETYLAMWDRSESYSPGEGSLVGWLLSIARHRAIDRVRAAARDPPRPAVRARDRGDRSVARRRSARPRFRRTRRRSASAARRRSGSRAPWRRSRRTRRNGSRRCARRRASRTTPPRPSACTRSRDRPCRRRGPAARRRAWRPRRAPRRRCRSSSRR